MPWGDPDVQKDYLGGPFDGVSIRALASQLRKGTATSPDLAEAALAAAESTGAALGAFVTVDRQGAVAAAAVAQRELAEGHDRGPLHGIPVAVKDVIATAGLRTTMGSRHFEAHVPRGEAHVVAHLRHLGAIIIGKTTTHQFAYGPTGDRGLGGPARNPHDPRKVAGGSSAGSAAAVAAGIVPVALGTDTGGSVRIPAALCGIYGLRPTTGRLSTQGVFPVAPTLDTVGPIARSVGNLRAAWGAIASPTLPPFPQAPAQAPSDAGRLVPRITVVRSGLTSRAVPSQREAADRAAELLRDAGFDITVAKIPELEALGDLYPLIQGPELSAIHHQRMVEAPELFDPEILERLQKASRIEGWRYVEALERRRALTHDLGKRVASTDVLLLPTVPIEAPWLDQREAPDLGAGWQNVIEALTAFTAPFSVLGWPAMTVPIVGRGPLPQSVQLAARPGREDLLLQIAQALETSASETDL
jgi:aspartyl-tRNA(Asn)/glutamyl-tRNA(Gln) amidotransferase subunit A